jgi:hypothetical protein
MLRHGGTVMKYTRTVPIPKNTYSPCGNFDEDSDDPPPSPKKTDVTEMKIDKSLEVFIEALPHLEPLHYGFKLQASNQKGYCFCPLENCLTPWGKNHHVDNDYSVCGARHFQGPGLLQHCHNRGDEHHAATAFYLTTLFTNGMGLTQAAVHHGENDNHERQLMQTNKFLIVIINLLTVKNQTINQVNESIVNKACDTEEN